MNKLLFAALLLPVQIFAQNIAWVEKSAPVARETYAVSFSHDGAKVFSGSECGPTYLRIFESVSGNQLWQSQVDSPLMCAQGIKFNSNGSKVVTLEELGNMLIYDFTTPTPTKLSTVDLGTSYSFSIAFSPDGNKIATGCSEKKLLIHDINSATEIHNIDAHGNWVTGADWSVQEQIATCGDDLLVKLWDSAGNFIRNMSGHTKAVSCVKFTPDGKHILSGGKDNTIKIWETATGNLVSTLTGHTSEIKQIDVSDNGTLIVSGSFDETIRVWDFATGNQTHSFKKDGTGRVFSVDYMPGSTRYIVAGTSNGDVLLWDMLFPTDIMEANADNTISIYPNPCINELNIAGNGMINSVSLYDVTGKLVNAPYNITGEKAVVNTTQLTPGNYLLRFETEKSTGTLNFTKK